MRKLKRKIKTARSIQQEQGLLGLVSLGVEFLQKTSRRRKGSKSKLRIDTGAYYNDIMRVDLKRPANKEWLAPQNEKKVLTINWLMPPPGKGSGGHMTLFRFIKYFEDAGHTCHIYFHQPGPRSTVKEVIEAMGDEFPTVNATMEWLQPDVEMAEADVIFATSWQSAYTVYRSRIRAKKFYFVQDFEPYFYPVGGHYMLAENTYRMGLRGITAGRWLEKKLHEDYGMKTTGFDFGSDSTIYKHENFLARKEITYYARPSTPRRAFEFGILVLDLFHKLHPDYTINFVGGTAVDFKIPFPYNDLGILSPESLNKLYNRSAAGLVMSLTNMSLLPLELLSAGCIPVINEGDNNRLVAHNSYMQSSLADPLMMAKSLSEIVSRKDLVDYARAASKSVQAHDWDTSGRKIVATVVDSFHKDGDA